MKIRKIIPLNQAGEEDDNEKNEASTKPSIFSNLELDPDWAPKPPPEKVFKVRPEDDPDNN